MRRAVRQLAPRPSTRPSTRSASNSRSSTRSAAAKAGRDRDEDQHQPVAEHGVDGRRAPLRSRDGRDVCGQAADCCQAEGDDVPAEVGHAEVASGGSPQQSHHEPLGQPPGFVDAARVRDEHVDSVAGQR